MEKILFGIVIGLLVLVIIILGLLFIKMKKEQEKDIQKIDEEKINSTVSAAVNKNLVDITNQFNNLQTHINSEMNNVNKTVNDNIKDNTTQFNNLKSSISTDMGNMNKAVTDNLKDTINQFDKLKQSISTEIVNINKLITDNLTNNTKENKEHLEKVVTSLTKINESSKNLDVLGEQIEGLRKVLSVNQLTGRFGEEVLENIIIQVFGETHGLYDFQTLLSNGKKPDAVINFPAPINKVCIDSKFNFVEYKELFFNEDASKEAGLKSNFKNALRNEIDKISVDYHIKDETSEFVILFMPNDSIFNYIQNDADLYNQIYVYARKKNVILTAPSSLQPILMTLNVVRINVKTKENIEEILKTLKLFLEDIKRLDERWGKVKSNLSTLSNAVDNCDKTVGKVIKKSQTLVDSEEILDKEDNNSH